jgi:DNA-binding PadR family transcriptional regulator
MERSLKSFWPRAASRIYEEPKRLASLGLAKATRDAVGRRARTTYSITPSGRRTLARWLEQPGAGPVLEFDALLRVFFAEHSTRSGVLTNIDAIKDWAAEQNAANVAFARLYTETGGPFPERLPAIVLTGKFLTDRRHGRPMGRLGGGGRGWVARRPIGSGTRLGDPTNDRSPRGRA